MKKWLFVIRVVDKPGVLTRVASVFSNRGVSLDSITGHGALGAIRGTLVVTLQATEKKKNELERTLRRVNTINSVAVYDYTCNHLRKSSLICLGADPDKLERLWEEWGKIVRVELVKSEDDDYTVYLITGEPAKVDALLKELIGKELLTDIVSSIIAV